MLEEFRKKYWHINYFIIKYKQKFYDEQIAKIGQAYAITFYIKMKSIKKDYLNHIMEIMLEKILSLNNKDVWLECKTALNVPSNNIIVANKIHI